MHAPCAKCVGDICAGEAGLLILPRKIEFIERDMMVQRKTASRYLDKIVAMGLLEKVKLGTSNYYVNAPLVALLSRVNVPENGKTGT